ncbi:Aste57867_10323 [Aphanomyces stellatus]|uniref:Aste57867_10323 protein n=1 Tax=Aphanomyces stellatus TaxID=120398 RepID=A0A485KQ51_9STRA|nr:hypothetical protein As57867_010283 [Aphanomyces stellatus]VFT87197.1 Aste57867_10323 [Aphanomyces stellatus]
MVHDTVNMEEGASPSPRPFVGMVATPPAVASQPSTRRPKWLRLATGLLVVCGIACVAIGAIVVYANHKNDNKAGAIVSSLQQAKALKITLELKRESMMYFGQPTADVYVFPLSSSGAKITSQSSFQFDAVLALQHDNVQERYVYVDHRAYYVKSQDGQVQHAACLTASQVPPFSLAASAMANAKVLDEATVGDESLHAQSDCPGPDAQLLHLSFAGESFIFCSSGDTLTRATGHDMNLVVTYLSDETLSDDVAASWPSLDIPTDVAGQPLQCDVLDTDSSVEAQESSLLDMATEITTTVMGARSASLMGASCGCKTEKKPCLFVHGLGNPFVAPISDSFSLYWGDVHKHMPCCSSTKFVHFNTFKLGWNDPSIQQDFCNAAVQVSGAKAGQPVGKIILVTHSMGNMIAGAAVAAGKCRFSKDVTWISSAGPMKGSKSANLFDRKCTEGGWNDLIKKPLELIGICPPTPAFHSLLYQDSTDQNTHAALVALQNVRRQYVTKTLCGVDDWGLNTIFSLPFKVVGEWTQHGDRNDGVVALGSCVEGIGMDGFGGATTSKNYLGRLNHIDLAFRNGDGWWGSDRKPVKWLECAL